MNPWRTLTVVVGGLGPMIVGMFWGATISGWMVLAGQCAGAVVGFGIVAVAMRIDTGEWPWQDL